MDWKNLKTNLGVNDMDNDLEVRRTASAYWAYTMLAKAFDQIKEERTDPQVISNQDQRAAAMNDMLRAAGIDLTNPVHRDVLVIFCTLMHQICDGEEEIATMTMTTCEMALKAEPDAPLSGR